MTELHFPLSASLIAKWFVARTSDDAEQDLSNLKLQKLLFLAQSRYIHEHGVSLIKEDFEAWDHAPPSESSTGVQHLRGSPVLVELADDGPWTRLPASAVAMLDQTGMNSRLQRFQATRHHTQSGPMAEHLPTECEALGDTRR